MAESAAEPASGRWSAWRSAQLARLPLQLRRALFGRHEGPCTFSISSDVFLRALGLLLAIAFASFGVQVIGLIGRDGVMPAAELMAYIRSPDGGGSFLQLPTVFWLGVSDGALLFVCVAGIALGLGVAIGFAQRWLLGCAWFLYLSLCCVGSVFMSFQWDALLLEATFLATLLASPRLFARRAHRGPAHALLRFTLAKLMLMSGCVKLASGDPAWRDGSALRFHYWTQPLPTVLARAAAALPDSIEALSCWAMFVVELVLPFFVFAPRNLRHAAAWGFIGLQLLIALTGNYGFFNLLTLALSILLFDDALLSRWFRPAPSEVRSPRKPAAIAFAVFAVFAVLFILLGVDAFAERFGVPIPILDGLAERVAPFRTINGYGLFAVMTKERQEISLEGSRDGKTWLPYRFRYKPQALDEAPRWVQPHMPRLDWQMWFAALSSCGRNAWFLELQKALLHNSSAVKSLFARTPFGDEPPRFLRARQAPYRFAPRGSGAFWSRGAEEPYCPVLTLGEDGELRRANP